MTEMPFIMGDSDKALRTVKMISVTVVFLENGYSSTAIAPMEVFASAGTLWETWNGDEPSPRFHVTTASAFGQTVRSSELVSISPQRPFADIDKTDLVFVPAAGLSIDAMCDGNAGLLPWLRKMHDQGARIASVCSGVALVAASGLLDGKRATTHWGLVEAFRRRFPQIDWRPELIVTEDDRVLCGGGIYAALDLSLYLVEAYCGHEVAVQTAKSLLVEMPRTYQTEFAVLPLGKEHKDAAVKRAEQWIHSRFHTSFNFDDVAREVGMSARTFIRRFRAATGDTPMTYLQKLRIAAARRTLESSTATIQEVSSAVGYDDVAFFRDLFKRHTGVTPNQYRKSFGLMVAAE